MKVRTKITLWISLSSFFAALFFSSFVFFELMEEPHKLINRELLDTGNAILRSIESNKEPGFSPEDSDYPLARFWIRLTKENGEVLYASPLTSSIDIPLKQKTQFYSVVREISPHHVWTDPLEEDDLEELRGDKVKFKVLALDAVKNNEKLTLVIAKPLAMLSAEVRDLAEELLLYILLTTVLIVCISYSLAGKILQPLVRINNKIREIRENSLNERIALSKSEDELHALSLSLNSMFDRLYISFQQQKEFISSASHEMRSPLAVLMLGHEEMLSTAPPEKLCAELTKQLNIMQRLNKLVKDLLDISLLERQEFIEREEMSLPMLIERVLEDFDEMLQAKNITCSVKADRLKVLADHDKLLRVFINLIDNAIKYNEPGGTIRITTRKKDNSALITIANSGSEIPKDDLPNVFKQFYRVEKSRSKKYGGTGLGLTIVKRIVELHGGAVKLTSADDETTVTLTIPLS